MGEALRRGASEQTKHVYAGNAHMRRPNGPRDVESSRRKWKMPLEGPRKDEDELDTFCNAVLVLFQELLFCNRMEESVYLTCNLVTFVPLRGDRKWFQIAKMAMTLSSAVGS